MADYTKALKEHLITIDSDDCVFDTIGIKQLECFCPMMESFWSK